MTTSDLSVSESSLPTDWPTIEAELRHGTGDIPILALMAASRLGDEIVQPLLDELDACAEFPMERIDQQDWILHLHALLLLAVRREPRALLPLLNVLRLEDDLLEELLGDMIADFVPRALAAICPAGQEQALFDFAADSRRGFWPRSAALQALTIRVFEGDLPRATLHQWLVSAAEAEAERMRHHEGKIEFGTESGFLTSLVMSLEEIGAADQVENVNLWYAQGLIDPMISSAEQIEERLLRDFETCRLQDMPSGLGYPRDAVTEAEHWVAAVQDVYDDDLQDDPFDDDDLSDDDWSPEPPKPFVRDGAKVGRNDPCPCGSGAKFKRCCGA